MAYIRCIGGMYHGHSISAYKPDMAHFCYRESVVDGCTVAVPSRWPPDKVAVAIALVRVYGQFESHWPSAALESVYGKRERWPAP